MPQITVFFSLTVQWTRQHSVAHSRERQHLNTVIGELSQAAEHDSQIGCFARIHFVISHANDIGDKFKIYFVALQEAICVMRWRRLP